MKNRTTDYKEHFENFNERHLLTHSFCRRRKLYRLTTDAFGNCDTIYYGPYSLKNRFSFNDGHERFSYLAVRAFNAILETKLRETAYSRHNPYKDECLYYLKPEDFYKKHDGRIAYDVIQEIEVIQEVNLVSLAGSGKTIAGVDSTICGRYPENYQTCSELSRHVHKRAETFDGILYPSSLADDDLRPTYDTGNILVYGSRVFNKLEVTKHYRVLSDDGIKFISSIMLDKGNFPLKDTSYSFIKFGIK